MQTKTKIPVVRLILILAFALIVIAYAIYCGREVFHLLRGVLNDPRDLELEEIIRALGIKGIETVAIAQVLTIFFVFLPSVPIQVFSGFVYGIPLGMLICMLGVCLGSSLLFMLVKTLGEHTQKLVAKNKTLNTLRGYLQNPDINVSLFAVLLFVMPILPYGILCIVFGNTRLRSWKFIIISFFACAIDVVVNVAIGAGIASDNTAVIVTCIVVAVALFVAFLVFKDRIIKMVVDISKKKDTPEH